MNLDEFFDDIGYSVGKIVYPRIHSLINDPSANPGVNTLCLISQGVDTPEQYIYSSEGFDDSPRVINGDGDGTVNLQSLQICEQWGEGAQSKMFQKISHSDMIMNDDVIEYIVNQIKALNEIQPVARLIRQHDLQH